MEDVFSCRESCTSMLLSFISCSASCQQYLSLLLESLKNLGSVGKNIPYLL